MIHLCISTVGSEDAPDLARKLVEERLAACVNIVAGARSIYRWKEKICDDEESILLIKTASQPLADFEQRFRELHPYDCPELLRLPIESGLEEYLSWVSEMTS